MQIHVQKKRFMTEIELVILLDKNGGETWRVLKQPESMKIS